MKRRSFFFFMALFVFVALSGCDSNQVFEENKTIKGDGWQYIDTLDFTVPISDTSSQYDLFLNVRHSQQYQWRNLWVVLHTRLPSGLISNTRIDLPLAEADGKWYGKCTGDICFARIPIQMSASFPDTGTYNFAVEQNMRQNPLPHLLGMGLRIEKSQDMAKID